MPDRRCCICGGAFETRCNKKTCSPACAKEHERRRNQAYERSHDRREYYRQYHQAHREHRNAMMRARYKLYGEQDRQNTALHAREKQAARLAQRHAQMARWRQKNALALKVQHEWRVTIREARRMIETGTFPE